MHRSTILCWRLSRRTFCVDAEANPVRVVKQPKTQKPFRAKAYRLAREVSASLHAEGMEGLGCNERFRKLKPVSLAQVPGLFGAEVLHGIHPTAAALRTTRRRCHALYVALDAESDSVAEVVTLASRRDIPVIPVDRSVLDILSELRRHQGVCLDVSPLAPRALDVDALQRPQSDRELWLLLENVLDPMNLGAILRSAYFFGVTRVVLPADAPCSRLSPVVSKASSGAAEVMPVFEVSDGATLLRKLRSLNYDVIGTATPSHATAVQLQSFVVTKPSVLVFGNEGAGLSRRYAEHCSSFITIQSPDLLETSCVESLNVSAAAAVTLYALGAQAKQTT